MFRNLGPRIVRRKIDLEKKHEAATQADDVIREVMGKYHPYITIQFKNNNLVINTKHKAVAQDIILNVKLLHRALLARNVHCKKIIIT